MSRIVFIHLYNDRSGSPKVLSQVIALCQKQGISTELITSNDRLGFLSGTADVVRHSFYKRSENKLLTLFFFLLSQCHIFFLCWRYRNKNVTFYVNTMLPVSAGIAGRLLGKRVVFHIHETSIKPELLKRILRFFIQKTANKLIFVSNYLSKVEAFQDVESTVVYNAVEKPGDRFVSHKECVNRSFNILMVCSLKKYKGVIEFVALSKRLAYMNFTLVLNENTEKIDAILASWNVVLPDNVQVYSRQSDVSRFYLESSVVLNLSRPDGWIETFGLTIVEAMSYGKPVIVPPIGGPAEIVTDGIQGYCLSCYDLDALSKALTQLYQSPKLYESMSNAALNRAKDFSIEEFERRTLDALC